MISPMISAAPLILTPYKLLYYACMVTCVTYALVKCAYASFEFSRRLTLHHLFIEQFGYIKILAWLRGLGK